MSHFQATEVRVITETISLQTTKVFNIPGLENNSEILPIYCCEVLYLTFFHLQTPLEETYPMLSFKFLTFAENKMREMSPELHSLKKKKKKSPQCALPTQFHSDKAYIDCVQKATQ